MSAGDLNLRMSDGTWATVGTALNPLQLRVNDGWETFGGGGGPSLFLRTPDNTWQVVSTLGLGRSITGTVYHQSGEPAADRIVQANPIGAPSTVVVTTTNDQGRYSFTDLAFGTYQVRAYQSTAIDQFTSGRATLDAQNPSATLNLILAAGYWTEIISTQIPSGWSSAHFTRPGDSTVFFKGGDASNLAAVSSASNGTGVFAFEQGDDTYTSVTWMPVHIDLMRTFADQRTSQLANRVLEGIIVSFTVVGQSVLTVLNNPSPGHSLVVPGPGTGSIVYLGELVPDQVLTLGYILREVNPPHAASSGVTALPVVRNRAFNREFGETVWSGPLNTLNPSPTLVVQQTLDSESNTALYQVSTDQAPVPQPTSVVDLRLGAGIQVQFVYSYG